ncbi:MAG: TlpA family protein disulfide reductase [Gammaproteobacteria bacterium]|nr:TlpA family protein disulfide reductase [Gammaproteobacteria bacterium]MYK46370.1 TlpA family protein disulfide reductase [Gammaproteobacteria bacterium]
MSGRKTRKCVFTLAVALSGASLVLAEEASVMVLEGTTAAPYDNGDFTVFDPARRDPTRLEQWKNTAKPDERVPLEVHLEAQGVIAQAPIGPGAKFRVEIPVDRPRTASFAIYNAKAPDGRVWGPVRMGNNFILEPGRLELRMMRSDYSVITGGHYNDAVFNSWRLTDEYAAAQSEYDQLRTPVEGETEESQRNRWDRTVVAQNKVAQLEAQGRSNVALTDPDPLVRRLVIESAWSIGPWVADALRVLAKLTPEDPWVIERLAASQAASETLAKLLRPGDQVIDFTGETLDGELVHTADLRSNSRYLLLEFWASWCGPCRLEIPHMKQAYARFRDKGFEIVSFTVDEDREDWVEASEEEGLPWHNLGMGWETEAPLAYNARTEGLPNNYLVDSRTRTIIAKDLRRHKLDEKLEELLE